jgi:hypothetical protein
MPSAVYNKYRSDRVIGRNHYHDTSGYYDYTHHVNARQGQTRISCASDPRSNLWQHYGTFVRQVGPSTRRYIARFHSGTSTEHSYMRSTG